MISKSNTRGETVYEGRGGTGVRSRKEVWFGLNVYDTSFSALPRLPGFPYPGQAQAQASGSG